MFSVDTSSGELLLVNTLDREAQPEYNLTICVSSAVIYNT